MSKELYELYLKKYKLKSIDDLISAHAGVKANIKGYIVIKALLTFILLALTIAVPNTVADAIDKEHYSFYFNLLKWVLPVVGFIGIFFTYFIVNSLDDEINPYLHAKKEAIRDSIFDKITPENEDAIDAKLKEAKFYRN